MKKLLKKVLPYVFSIALIFVMLPLLFASCNKPEDPTDDLDKQAACEKLDTLVDKSYSTVNLTVTTKNGDITLVSAYEFSLDKVEYSIDKLTSFTLEDGVIVSPESYKETVTGTAEVKGDKVISLDGNLELPEYNVLVGGFNFDSENLTDYNKGEAADSFKVTDASAFLGTTVNTSDMNVSAVYNDNALISITVTYTDGDVSVTLNYSYGNLAE